MVAPKIHALEGEEVHRVNRVRMAFELRKLPAEIDAMPFTDYCDLLEVMLADRDYDAQQRALRRGKGA